MKIALVVALSLVGTSAWCATGKVRLKAFTMDQLAWEVGADVQKCKVVVKKAGARKASTHKLSREDCRKLSEQLRRVSAPDKPETAPIDDYRYELEIGGKRFPVAFNAPKRCQIGDEGNLACESQKLSPLQESLLILRRHEPAPSQGER